MSRLLSIDESAARLSVGRTTLKGLITTARLKTVKLGKRRLVPEDAVDRLIVELQGDQALAESSLK